MTETPSYYSVGKRVSDPVRQKEIKIKRSRFIASLAYAASMAEAKAFISRIAKENKRATHNCWAYIVGDKGELFHCSDAGEPAGTAGKPMLNILQHHNMTCVAAVVTRYYGGVKLGVRGLIEAYTQAVDEAVGQAPLIRLVSTLLYRVKLGYGMNDTFLSQVGTWDVQVVQSLYEDEVTHELAVEEAHGTGLQTFLQELSSQGRIEYTLLGKA